MGNLNCRAALSQAPPTAPVSPRWHWERVRRHKQNTVTGGNVSSAAGGPCPLCSLTSLPTRWGREGTGRQKSSRPRTRGPIRIMKGFPGLKGPRLYLFEELKSQNKNLFLFSLPQSQGWFAFKSLCLVSVLFLQPLLPLPWSHFFQSSWGQGGFSIHPPNVSGWGHTRRAWLRCTHRLEGEGETIGGEDNEINVFWNVQTFHILKVTFS